MNPKYPLEDKKPDNMTVTDSTAIIPQEQADQLVINCNKIILKDNGIEITLDGNMNYSGFKKIIINGVTFAKEKVRDDRDDPYLQYWGL